MFRGFLAEIILGLRENKPPLINQGVQKMQKLLSETEVDYHSLYQDMFNDTPENIPIWAKIAVNEYANTHTTAMVPAMHLMSMVYKIIRIGNQLKELKR